MKKITAFFCILSILSCKNDTEEIINYDINGNVFSKNYVSNGNSLDSIIYLKNNIIDYKVYFNNNSTDTCYVKYYDKNKISSEGSIVKKIKFGKWKFYNSKGKIRSIVEFKNICGEEYPNQEWNYNFDGKLNQDFCNYYTSTLEKLRIIEGVQVVDLKIYYIPMNKKKAICKIHFSPEIDNTFCNTDKVETYSLNSNKSFVFTIPLKTEGIKDNNFKGYIEEHLFETQNKKETVNHKIRRIYIDIPIYHLVETTLNNK